MGFSGGGFGGGSMGGGGGVQLGTAFSKNSMMAPMDSGGLGGMAGSDMASMGDMTGNAEPTSAMEPKPKDKAAPAAGGGGGVARSGAAMLPGLAQAFSSLARPSEPYQPPAFTR